MDKSNLKNIVVLKNLPSNLVDEAIVILKPNKRIKNLETINKNRNSKPLGKEKKIDGYVLKEAEMIVSDYFSEVERIKNKNNTNNLFKKKYNRLKKYTFFLSLILIISIVLNFI